MNCIPAAVVAVVVLLFRPLTKMGHHLSNLMQPVHFGDVVVIVPLWLVGWFSRSVKYAVDDGKPIQTELFSSINPSTYLSVYHRPHFETAKNINSRSVAYHGDILYCTVL